MSTIIYNNKAIIPSPFVSITKNYLRSANGELIGTTFTLQVNGTIVAHKGSPNSSGVFHTLSGYPADESLNADQRMKSLLKKMAALRSLFVDGGTFEIAPLDGSTTTKCNPRIVGPLTFEEGIWVDKCNYTITLEADILFPQAEDTFIALISDAVENWQLETDDNQPEGLGYPRTYRLTHTVSAVGKRYYDDTGALTQEPWKNARDFVLPKLGFDSNLLSSSGIKDLPSYYGGYNHVRSESIDEQGAGYGVTETWILTSGTAIEDFTIETSKTIEDGLARVNVQGTINGLEERNSNMGLVAGKYTNAEQRFTISSGLALSRAQLYSGYTLNISPASQTIGRNPVTGSITYSFGYDTRPSTLMSGALSESITIQDSLDTQAIAVIPILGRAAGPLMQSLSTKANVLQREVSIEAVFARPSFGSNSLSDLQSAFFGQRPSVIVSGIITAANPANQGYSQVYVVNNQETWVPTLGRYSRQVTWNFEL